MDWLQAAGIPTVSARERVDAPGKPLGAVSTGNVFIVTLPVTTGFRTEEFRALDRWIRTGNTLVVLAALADQPDWAYGFADLASGDLTVLTGLQFQSRGAGARLSDSPFIEPQRSVLQPNRAHAYFAGVREAVALSDFARRTWVVNIPGDGFVLSLAHDRDTHQGVLWTRALGSGRVIVSTLGSLFTNRALGLADNARLFSNVVAANLGPHSAVIFDDVHQGLSAEYDSAKFYEDRRLYYTVGILAALWLSWVFGSTKLRMPARRISAPNETELVRATGGYLSRVLRRNAGARRIFELFLRRVREHMPRAGNWVDDPWAFLAHRQQVMPADLRQLQAWYADVDANRRVPLAALHNLMLRIERQLEQ